MAGELVPLVMIPRFTTLAGASEFKTVGLDVSDYQLAVLNVWRGANVPSGASPTFTVTAQESTDQDNWTNCSGTNVNTAVTAGQEIQVVATLAKRWFRLKITLGGTNDAVLTCWAVGSLEVRET